MPEMAQLQTRRDRKYLLTKSQLASILETHSANLLAVHDSSTLISNYETIYFDTEDFLLHRAAAFNRRNRFKIRVRSYLDNQTTFLELKLKTSRSRTQKIRELWDYESRSELEFAKLDWFEDQLKLKGLDLPNGLRGAQTNTFSRVTLLSSDFTTRITIDSDLRVNDSTILRNSDSVIVETKTNGHASELDLALWRIGVRPQRISKNGIGIALFHPDQPSNKWHRIIEQSCLIPELIN